jgi:hypothetical protein
MCSSKTVFQQNLVVDWFLQKIGRSSAEGAGARRHVAVGRHKDDRQPNLAISENLLQLQAVHFRHPNVQYQAAPVLGAVGIEKFPSRRERLDVVIGLLDHPPQRFQCAGVVIDDEYGRSLGHCSFLRRRRA